MNKSRAIATEIIQVLNKNFEEEPVEAFLAFAALFSAIGIYLNITEEDAMNLVKNIYKDTLAQRNNEVH
jgi:hypothetical protein